MSAGVITAAKANADKAGVQIDAVKASYDEFPFGESQWDLVVLVFAWAPVTDPAFVARLRRSLRPGGLVVFEHLIDDPASPRPATLHALKPGQLRVLFDGLTIVRYEEADGVADWGGPGNRLVRMIASKR